MVRVVILSNDALSKIAVGQYWKKILDIKYTIYAFADNGTVECYGFEYCLFGSIVFMHRVQYIGVDEKNIATFHLIFSVYLCM